jgi:sulfatase maturation enzyme AslB (radical SAM superfamily)
VCRFYQISFDGPREWHDRKRVLANGERTYDRIWSHLCQMKEGSA